LNDYGFPFLTVCFLNNYPGYYPLPTDVYSPYEPNYGNSGYGDPDLYTTINWGEKYDNAMDSRIFYVFKQAKDFSRCRWPNDDTSVPHWYRWSNLSQNYICYTPEALFFA
jgi:hypothetical protein